MKQFFLGLLIALLTIAIFLSLGYAAYAALEYIHKPQTNPAILIHCNLDKHNNLICPLNNVTVYNVNGRLAK